MGFQGFSRRQLLASCALTAVSGCTEVIGETVPAPTPNPTGDDWLSARYDARNTAYNPGARPPETRPRKLWSYGAGTLHKPIERPWNPIVASGRVIVSTFGGLHALSPEDGTAEWRFEPDEDVYAQPTVAGDTVYLGTDGKKLRALSVEEGTERWIAETPDWGSQHYRGIVPVLTPTVANERIYTPSPGAMYVFDGAGNEVWRTQISDPQSNVTVEGEHFYSVSYSLLTAVETTDLDRKFLADPSVRLDEVTSWQFDSNQLSSYDRMHVTPALANGLVYAPVTNRVPIKEQVSEETANERTVWKGEPVESALYALDAQTGEPRWRHFIGGDVGYENWACPPVVFDDTVVAGGYDGPLVGLDPTTGDLRWQTDFVNVSVAVGGGSTVVASGKGGIAAFDVRTGERHWTRNGENAIGLTVAGERIYVTSFDDERSPPLRVTALS